VAGVSIAVSLSARGDLPQAADKRKAERVAQPTPAAQPPGAGKPGASLTEDPRRPIGTPDLIAGEGIVEPADREVKVAPPVGGVITHIFVKEGDHVDAGAPLVELEDSVERRQVVTAEADVKAAASALQRAQENHRPEDRKAAVADAETARARASLSQAAYTRTKALFSRSAATPDDLDKARYQAEMDSAAAVAQEARAEAARKGWSLDIEGAQDALQQAQARLAEAKARLERLTVRAPMAGTILQLIVRDGEYVNPGGGTALVTMGDLRKIRVRIDVDERDISEVKLGARGYATVEAFGDKHFPGRVVEIGRRMGRKNLRTDEPTERIDTKILEVVLELDDGHELPQGERAVGFIQRRSAQG
jgi:HlyD family secretion protein